MDTFNGSLTGATRRSINKVYQLAQFLVNVVKTYQLAVTCLAIVIAYLVAKN